MQTEFRVQESAIGREETPADFISTSILPEITPEIRHDLEEMGFVNLIRAWDIASSPEKDKENGGESQTLISAVSNRPAICSVAVDEKSCNGGSVDFGGFRYDAQSGFCVKSRCKPGVNVFSTYGECVDLCGQFEGKEASLVCRVCHNHSLKLAHGKI